MTLWWIQGLSRTCGMKFKDFQATVLFSSTFKDFQGCVGTLYNMTSSTKPELRNIYCITHHDKNRTTSCPRATCKQNLGWNLNQWFLRWCSRKNRQTNTFFTILHIKRFKVQFQVHGHQTPVCCKCLITRLLFDHNGVFTHTLRWDGMVCAALVTQCVNASVEIHWVTSAAHPIPAQHVCECTVIPVL